MRMMRFGCNYDALRLVFDQRSVLGMLQVHR